MITELFIPEVAVERLRSHIHALEGVRHPLAAPEALEQAAEYIERSLREFGYDISYHPFIDNGRPCRNVIATRRGALLPDERVLVVAHYDTVAETPGADDNASGVAVMLEMARLLAPSTFERTVQFVAVNLEEVDEQDSSCSGTRGSRALAAHARENDWNIQGVFVLESVAYAGEKVVQSVPPGVPVKVPQTGDFIAVIGNEHSGELVTAFARSVQLCQPDLPYVPLVVPGNGELLPDTRRSDHAPFWDHGFRAVMITDTTNFRNPNYHHPTDTLDTLNLDFAAKVCGVTASLVLQMAQPGRSPWFRR